jgi:hypothetical protein
MNETAYIHSGNRYGDGVAARGARTAVHAFFFDRLQEIKTMTVYVIADIKGD